jgi:hypothetical protein
MYHSKSDGPQIVKVGAGAGSGAGVLKILTDSGAAPKCNGSATVFTILFLARIKESLPAKLSVVDPDPHLFWSAGSGSAFKMRNWIRIQLRKITQNFKFFLCKFKVDNNTRVVPTYLTILAFSVELTSCLYH